MVVLHKDEVWAKIAEYSIIKAANEKDLQKT